MSFDGDADLALHLVGPLRLVRRDGVEVTPRIAKAQAILALLGTSPALRRPRAWVQDKLWSELPPENGSASLRQTIHRLREAVGPDHGWLTNVPGWVGLDPKRVSVIMEPTGTPGIGLAIRRSSAKASTSPIRSSRIASAIQRFACEERLADRRVGRRCRPAPSRRRRAQAKATMARMLVAPPHADDEDLRTLAEILGAEVAAAAPLRRRRECDRRPRRSAEHAPTRCASR